MPLHLAAMLHSGKEAEAVVTALLEAHPEGAKGKDKVRRHTPDFSHPHREFLSLPHPQFTTHRS